MCFLFTGFYVSTFQPDTKKGKKAKNSLAGDCPICFCFLFCLVFLAIVHDKSPGIFLSMRTS